MKKQVIAKYNEAEEMVNDDNCVNVAGEAFKMAMSITDPVDFQAVNEARNRFWNKRDEVTRGRVARWNK